MRTLPITCLCPECGHSYKVEMKLRYLKPHQIETCPACGAIYALSVTLTTESYRIIKVESKMNYAEATAPETPARERPQPIRENPQPKSTDESIPNKKIDDNQPKQKDTRPVSTYPKKRPQSPHQPYGLNVTAKSFSVNHAHFRGKLETQAANYRDYLDERFQGKDYDLSSAPSWEEWVRDNCSPVKSRINVED